MIKDYRVKPAEWKGKEEHQEDIMCGAIMQNTPMFLATGSFDGEIIIWNSLNESATKRLTARKRASSKNKVSQWLLLLLLFLLLFF